MQSKPNEAFMNLTKMKNNMQIELNPQQVEFILDELKNIREGNNYSQYAKTITQQLYEKLMPLQDYDTERTPDSTF